MDLQIEVESAQTFSPIMLPFKMLFLISGVAEGIPVQTESIVLVIM